MKSSSMRMSKEEGEMGRGLAQFTSSEGEDSPFVVLMRLLDGSREDLSQM